MLRRSLGEIAVMCGGRTDCPAVSVAGVSTDSRTLVAGNLFVPLVGPHFDGHAFAEQAAMNGAAATLWSSRSIRPPRGLPLVWVGDSLLALQIMAANYRRELPGLHLIGVTGSNGKTSVKDMLAAILGTRYKTQATSGNRNNQIGVPLTLLALDEQTEMAVVEMGMSGRGEIRLLSQLAVPELAIITSIGAAHLADLGSMQQIAAAKLEILQGLTVDGHFVANGDSPLLAPAIAERQAITFGLADSNQFRPLDVRLQGEGMVFRVNQPDSPLFWLPLLGQHQVQNAVGAIAAARALGLSYGDIELGLSLVKATGQRGELLRFGLTTIINDTYKSNPDSAQAALETFCSLQGYGKRIAVLGDMRDLGDAEREQHLRIGALLDPEQVDTVITIGDAARQIATVASRRFSADRVFAAGSKEDALGLLLQRLGREPVLLLIKGANVLALQDLVQAIGQI